MPAELLIRPGRNDHLVVADLIAPGTLDRFLGFRPSISRLVLDAPVAVARRQFAEDAQAAGLPVVIDPMTFLLQTDIDPGHPWAQLPYAVAPAVQATEFADLAARQALTHRTIEFQLEHGATVIVPPYFFASGPDDPWFQVSLQCVTGAAEYLRDLGARMPLAPVLTGRLDRFARPSQWSAGIDRFADTAVEVGAQTVATQLGPAGLPKDNYARVLHLFQAAQRLRRPGLAVHAWRQGVYGPALVAAGLQGYETGICAGEKTDLASVARNRRPPRPAQQERGDSRAVGGSVYIRQLGRSVPRRVVNALQANLPIRARIVCDDASSCCPNGIESTVGRGRRAHAVRSRARYLADLEAMPAQTTWRLHKIAQDATATTELITIANRVLTAAGIPPLSAGAYEALATTAEQLRGGSSAVA